MVTGRPLPPLELSPSDRERLESMAKSRSLSHGLVRRAEISLLAAEGGPNEAVAAAVGVTRATVGKWRRRFLENGLQGLHMVCSPIDTSTSRFPPILSLSTKYGISSACT